MVSYDKYQPVLGHFPVVLKLGRNRRFPKTVMKANLRIFRQCSEDVPAADGSLSPADLEKEALLLTKQFQELLHSCQVEDQVSSKNRQELTTEKKASNPEKEHNQENMDPC